MPAWCYVGLAFSFVCALVCVCSVIVGARSARR